MIPSFTDCRFGRMMLGNGHFIHNCSNRTKLSDSTIENASHSAITKHSIASRINLVAVVVVVAVVHFGCLFGHHDVADYLRKHNGTLPNLDLVRATFRQTSIDTASSMEEAWSTTMWFTTELLPCVSSKWRKICGRRTLLSTFNECVTVTDEAFAYRIYEMYKDAWKEDWNRKTLDTVAAEERSYKRFKKNNQQ